MKIVESVFEQLIKCPKAPPEVGGVIGGNLQTVNCFKFVHGENSDNIAFFSPNVNEMNSIISLWQKKGIELYGIFHSHPSCCPKLTDEDKQYAIQIMKAMPVCISSLYFPIVIPNKDLFAYKAIKSGNKIRFIIEKTEVVRG